MSDKFESVTLGAAKEFGASFFSSQRLASVAAAALFAAQARALARHFHTFNRFACAADVKRILFLERNSQVPGITSL
jgi:hypothetical protein